MILTLDEITPASTTIENFKRRIARLYEQGADSIRIGRYVQKWFQWLFGGFGMLELSFVEIFHSQTCEVAKESNSCKKRTLRNKKCKKVSK